jgi:acetylornithine deacetylase/succinyl-diaminopimelate desuccinylase-like protein
VAPATDRPTADLSELGSDALEHLRSLIRFDTVNPPGNERPAADYVAAVGRSAGLDAQVIESAPGRGSALLRLRGNGRRRPILLLGHLDTVPCEPARWTHDPWAAEVAEGCVWGRGAIDSKLTTATQLAALVAIARAGRPLDRDLILAATASEEMGGPANGAAYLAAHHRDLIEAEYTLSEHGGFCLEIGRRPYYTLQTAEKGGCSVDLVARGSPGHASVPHDDNPIPKLGRALAGLQARRMPPRPSPTVRAFVEAIAADQEGRGAPEVARTLRALLDPATADAALAALPTRPGTRDMVGAMLRNTAAPTILSAGTKRNVIPSEARAELSGRPVPGVDRATFLADLGAVVGDEVDLVVHDFTPALEWPRDDAFEAAALRALRRHDADAVLVPLLMPLGTDAKRLTGLDTKIYGFVPMVPEPELDYMRLCHGHDERASLRSIEFGATVLRDLLLDLAAQ